MTVQQKTNSSPSEWRAPVVALVGIGMGKGDLTERALEFVARAEALAGGRRQLELFPDHPGKRIILQSPLGDALAELEHVSRDRRTVVLASGDPLFYGIGRRLLDCLGRERIVVIPNITALQALCARIAEPWDDVRIASLHGREDAEWLAGVRAGLKTALFTDARHTPVWIARRLVDSGLGGGRCTLVVAEDMGLPSESVRFLTPDEALGSSFAPLNMTLVLPNTETSRCPSPPSDFRSPAYAFRPVLGLPEDAFEHEAGMITKMEIRVVAVALLQLAPGLTLWDLGAASGSVSIEAARVARLGRVIAVEKNTRRFNDLAANVEGFHLRQVEPYCGSALSALKDEKLPDPDRVFIGGSGGELPEVLREVERRLRPGGRVVQTVVALENLETARSFWQSRKDGFDMSVTQLQVSRSAPVGSALRLDALNPVFIISAWRRG